MKNLSIVFLLILVLFIPLTTFFNPGLPITHDGQDHVARIANFYASLIDGNLIPRWANNLNWGYGHPILMFLYPLPSYTASIFHMLGLSFVDSVKAVFGLTYILSGIFMFLWLRNFLGKYPAIIGALTYSFAPYRFVDLYVRGAIGEHFAFVFMPAICYFLLKLNFEKKFNFVYFLGLSVSTAGLVLSHNAISLMFIPFVFLYLFYLLFLKKNKKLFGFSLAGIVYGFALSAFFWIPAFFEGKYTLRDIVAKNEALSRFVDLPDLFYGTWNFGGSGMFSTQIGIIPLIFILLMPLSFYILYKRKEKNNLILVSLSAIFLFVSIILMLEVSRPVWIYVSTLQKFQFPWRFLTISVFSVSVIAGYIIYLIKKENYQKAVLILVLFSSILLTKDYWKANGFLNKEESYFSGIYKGTTDTGESAPIWSVRFMEKKPKAEVEVIEGRASIKKLLRTTSDRTYEIVSIDRSRIRENTLYFPGWKVFIDGKEEKNIEFQDPNNRGLITFFVNDGKHIVSIKFENTKLRIMSDYVSLVSVLSLILLSIITRKKWLIPKN